MLDTPSSSLMIAFLVVTAALAAADSADSRTAQTDALPEEDVLLLQMGVELHGNTQAPSAVAAAQPAVAPAGDQRPPLDQILHPPGSAPSIPTNAATKLPFAGSPPSIAALAEQGGVKEAEAENLSLLQVTSSGIGFFTLFLIILVVLVFLAIVWGLCRPPNPTTQGSPASEKQRTRRGVDFDRGLRPPSALNSAVSARTSLKETEPPAGTLAVAERQTARGVLDRGASDPSAASLLSSLTTAFRSGGRDAQATGSAPSTSTGRRPQEQADQPERIERLPPPLAPALVVQSSTVRFYVEAPVLSRMVSMGSGSVDVFVPSGKKLFNITLDVSAQNSKTLALFTTGAEDDPRGVVVNSFDYSNRLQILGRKGVLYGEIEITSTGGRVLREGSPVMAVQIGAKNTLEATAQSVSGRQQYAGGAIDQNRWNFQAVPGFDAVLGLVTILSLLTEM